MRSPAIAIACAIENVESTVMILPFFRMRLAATVAGAAGACAMADEPAAAAAVAAPAMKRRRVLLVMISISAPNAAREVADKTNSNWSLKSALHVRGSETAAAPGTAANCRWQAPHPMLCSNRKRLGLREWRRT